MMLSEHTFLNCCPVTASDAMWRIYRRIWQVAAAASAASASPSAKILAARSRQARPLSLKDMRRDVRWKSVAPSLALSLATAFDTNYFKDIP
jgi:hypothetical protein